MAALLDNGEYPDIMFGRNLAEVDASRFAVPWWFRSEFRSTGSARTAIRCAGVIPKADLWVNGALVAGREALAGAYAVTQFDVTGLVHDGTNGMALLVHPGGPMEELSIGWVDWNAWPPDHNMGPWRDVHVVETGDVSLGSPGVRSQITPAGAAELTIEFEVQNLSTDARAVRLAGLVKGPPGDGSQSFIQEVELAAEATQRAVFDLRIDRPALWWPVGEGEQPLYHLQLSATCDGVVSDTAMTSFGIRHVDSHVAPGGGRQFVVNGRQVQIRGAGWSPDIFLRHDGRRLADELAYARHLGLNAIRLEGKLENPEFYDLADRMGIMVLPGWECCDKWEAWAGMGGLPWEEHDYEVAARSMSSEAILLRNHPCVVAFLIGSDFAPPPRQAEMYADALARAGWDVPVVASATAEGTDATGPSGMKMTGPYDWVPPVFWYDRDPGRGGAVGFNSETGPGHSVPRMPSLQAMLSDAELQALWQQPAYRQLHAAPPSVFDNLEIFNRALSERYGVPTGLPDYVRKAQLANYEMTRAMFEAYGARAGDPEPATGVIYWMLNNAWPSLNWHLYDWFLDPAGSYFGARKANEAVHVQYAYDSGEVVVVNRAAQPLPPATVTARTRFLDGKVDAEIVKALEVVEPRTVVPVFAAPAPADATGTFFLELQLELGVMGVASRNVYWLSTSIDEVDWDAADWHYTPVKTFADLKGLAFVRPARVEVSAASTWKDGTVVTTVEVGNASADGSPAVGLHVSVVRGASSSPVAPVLWSDNDLVLFAGQLATIEASYASSALGRSEPFVRVDGFNLFGPSLIAAPAPGPN
jgi:exo-1,4-beta-D-glucosaminidase